ncbi:MAG TPA: DEAD/DEAH box helicase, partial [Candidatus Glassbacteria bacterium]|nr:DEAD/DEAH box helicase [Candidatus Glassbacteria bacterium]
MRVQYLSGVGPRRAEQLARIGIRTVSDLLYLFPRRYIDATAVVRIGTITTFEGELTITGTVASARQIRGRGGRSAGFEAVLDDGTGRIVCSFFGRGFLSGVMERGQRWIVFGRLKLWRDRLFLDPIEYERLDGDRSETGPLGKSGGVIPVYPATEGLGQKMLRRFTAAALPAASFIPDKLPEAIRQSLSLPSRPEAFRLVHRPAKIEEAASGRRALAFEELFYLELMLLGRKFHIGSQKRVRKYVRHNHLLKKLAASLPFRLTGAQKRVLREIDADLAGPHPLNRLLQGDVGSGKTIVALIAALRAVENGYQAALMAPTEVLAEQHYRTLSRLLAPLELEPALLLGKLPPGEKRRAAE